MIHMKEQSIKERQQKTPSDKKQSRNRKKQKELQQQIRNMQYMLDRAENDQLLMLEIGRQYLESTILKDPTAAEAWLTRAMCAKENALAVQAMELIGHHIAGKERILTDEDYKSIREKLSDAAEAENEYLQALASLGQKERLKMPGRR